MQDVFIGRQPIYNDNLGVYAYELLFRSQNTTVDAVGGNAATAQVIVDSFFEIGVEKLVGKSNVAINASDKLIQEADLLPIPPKRIILELSHDIGLSLDNIEALQRLASLGFIIAIDDHIDNNQLQPLLPLANIIKVDVQYRKGNELKKYVKNLRKLKIPLLALKVESLAEYEYYRDLGFHYFQGYFLSRPRLLKATKLSENKISIINLLRALYDWQTENEEVARLIGEDITISYKLLKMINSAYFSLPGDIKSIKQAVILLGRKTLRSWVSMLALTGIDDQPLEVTRIAIIRAKMCESLAQKAKITSADSFFTVGIFSALDILMNCPISNVIDSLPLNDDIKAALLNQEGTLGEALKCTLAYENSKWTEVKFQELDNQEITSSYLESVDWANNVMATV